MRRQERLESTPPLRSMLFEEGGEEEGGKQAIAPSTLFRFGN